MKLQYAELLFEVAEKQGIEVAPISIGRSYRDAPEIDGLVLIEDTVEPGQIVSVEITGTVRASRRAAGPRPPAARSTGRAAVSRSSRPSASISSKARASAAR